MESASSDVTAILQGASLEQEAPATPAEQQETLATPAEQKAPATHAEQEAPATHAEQEAPATHAEQAGNLFMTVSVIFGAESQNGMCLNNLALMSIGSRITQLSDEDCTNCDISDSTDEELETPTTPQKSVGKNREFRCHCSTLPRPCGCCQHCVYKGENQQDICCNSDNEGEKNPKSCDDCNCCLACKCNDNKREEKLPPLVPPSSPEEPTVEIKQ